MKRVALLALALFLTACTETTSGEGLTSGEGATYRVRYSVTSASSADLTFQNENEDTSQITGAGLPWQYLFTARPGQFIYVSAQNNGGGVISCALYLDGTLVEQNESQGEYAICTASGSV